MNYLDKEKEREELEKLLAQELAEENEPDWLQYVQLCKGKAFKR